VTSFQLWVAIQHEEGQYAEGGAEFIDLDHSMMASYIQRCGLQRDRELLPMIEPSLPGK
jgi:hypothetical protein